MGEMRGGRKGGVKILIAATVLLRDEKYTSDASFTKQNNDRQASKTREDFPFAKTKVRPFPPGP